MLEIRTAFITELDDIEAAVLDVVEQITPATLPPNRLGILTCALEFIEEGILKAICDKLPFDVVGCNTTTGAVNGAADINQLSLMVLAADDVHFSVAVSDPFDNDHLPKLRKMCDAARAGLIDEPQFALTFSPMLFQFDDEKFIALYNEAIRGLPLFGTMACHYDGDYHDTMAIHNGEYYEDRAVIVFVSGNIRAEFAMASLPASRILKQKAVITKADDNILIEVNNMPVLEYMESLGLARDGEIVGMHAIPFILDFGDGREAPESRTVLGLSPEGYVLCGGEMPVGVGLALGAQDAEAVLETMRQVILAVPPDRPPDAMLLFSCHSRSLALGLDNMAEIECMDRALGDKVPFILAYSGGEICPVPDGNGGTRNASHSDTLVACTLYGNC